MSRVVAPEAGSGRLWALLLNGGGQREQNYQSHLLHVRELLDLLAGRGVPTERIAVFSGDGSDSADDLAVRELQPERDFWLIERLPLGRRLRTPVVYENSRIEGVRLLPATRAALDAWADRTAPAFRAGDVLLFYVTDHGTRDPRDTERNAIVLWGESLDVEGFRAWLERLPPLLRVVSVMSQCYAGAFADALMRRGGAGEISGLGCGYFASSAERPAYGCYPENRGVENVGHSFRLFEALRARPELSAAHQRVLSTDRTPDVPHRTSDRYLEQMLEATAARRGIELGPFVDALLAQPAPRGPRQREAAARMQEVGQAFGMPAPRGLSELAAEVTELRRMGRELRAHARRWEAALDDLKRVNLAELSDAYPAWRPYVAGREARGLDAEETRRMAEQLLEDLRAVADGDAGRRERLERLRQRAESAAEAGYRMEVREAALLRMRSLLLRIAGLRYLSHAGRSALRRELHRLTICEQLDLGPLATEASVAAATATAFPSLEEDRALLDAVRPGWIGIEFRTLTAERRRELSLEPGAVRVSRVLPRSPAESAGVKRGDVLLGRPGAPFLEPHEIREWVMGLGVGQTHELAALREGRPLRLRIRIGLPPG